MSDGRRHWARGLAVVLALGAVASLLAAAWLQSDAPRALVERRLAAALDQPVRLEQFDVHWRHGLNATLRGLHVGAGDVPAVARIESIELAPRVLPLLSGRFHFAHASVVGARLRLARAPDGRWNVAPRAERPTAGMPERAGRLRIEALVLDDVEVRLRDATQDLDLRVRIESMHDPADPRWGTRVIADGRAGRTPARGELLTAPVLALHAQQPLPLRARADVARTRLALEGEVTDPLGAPSGEADVEIAGPTLASLYPTLRLALPSTPPYTLRGRLSLQDDVYRMTGLVGKIGVSDISGGGELDLSRERPRLTARLTSARFALADLGAAIGVPAAGARGERLLPDAPFDVPRMRALDADVSLKAERLLVRPEVPLTDLSLHVLVTDGRLQLAPIAFGMAGGDLTANVSLDAREDPVAARADIDFRRVELGRLFPTLDTARVSSGRFDAQIRLAGRGRSVAHLLGSSDGTMALAMVGGRISHTVVAAASLDGGRLLPLLVKGDEPVAVRCAAASFTVERGIARTQLAVLDAATARIDAQGAIDLRNERLALELEATPKRPSVLSLRGPLTIGGSFRDPRVGVSGETLLRGGAAAALAVVNPLAALLPMIETGPAEDAACGDLLAQAPVLRKSPRQ